MELAGESESILTLHQKLGQEMPSTLLSVEIQQQWGIVRSGFVVAEICEAVDEAESDCDSEDGPFADVDEQ